MVDTTKQVAESKYQGFTIKQLQEWKKDATLGYLKMNIYEPPAEAYWGKHNNRVINEEWVAQLTQHFWENLENCTNADAIDMVVDKEWIKNADHILDSVDGKKIEDVQEIQFTAEGKAAISPNNLLMLGGNHRRLAMKMFVDELKAHLEVTEEEHNPKNKRWEKTTTFQEDSLSEQTSRLKLRIDELERRIGISQHWVVRLYSKGECEDN